MKGYRVRIKEEGVELTWAIEECEVHLRTADGDMAYKTKGEALKEVKANIRDRAENAAQQANLFKLRAQRLRERARGV